MKKLNLQSFNPTDTPKFNPLALIEFDPFKDMVEFNPLKDMKDFKPFDGFKSPVIRK